LQILLLLLGGALLSAATYVFGDYASQTTVVALSTPPSFEEAMAPDDAPPVVFRSCLSCHQDIIEDSSTQPPAPPPLPLVVTPSPLTPLAPPGVPVRLVIPAIGVDSAVVPVSPVEKGGELEWPVPLDKVGWDRDSGLAGAQGNLVVWGHVITRYGPGIFENLYKTPLGSPIQVFTDRGSQLTYVVKGIAVALPGETQYTLPTPDATLTLITCTGDFDPASRTFSHRLVVIAKSP